MKSYIYEWGTLVTVNGVKAVYVGENEYFKDPDVDGKYLVIIEDTDEVVECNNIRKVSRSQKRKNTNDLKWGDTVEVWDDDIDKMHPLKGIFLKEYDYRDKDDDLLYVIIPQNSSKIPSEGFLHCKKLVDN